MHPTNHIILHTGAFCQDHIRRAEREFSSSLGVHDNSQNNYIFLTYHKKKKNTNEKGRHIRYTESKQTSLETRTSLLGL